VRAESSEDTFPQFDDGCRQFEQFFPLPRNGRFTAALEDFGRIETQCVQQQRDGPVGIRHRSHVITEPDAQLRIERLLQRKHKRRGFDGREALSGALIRYLAQKHTHGLPLGTVCVERVARSERAEKYFHESDELAAHLGFCCEAPSQRNGKMLIQPVIE
jgi:hypothetical protein